jgi:hypothetical protein
MRINFEIRARSHGAEEIVPAIRLASKEFKNLLQEGNRDSIQQVSSAAWEAMVQLFNVLRNEQDHGSPIAAVMSAPTAKFVKEVTLAEMEVMIRAAKIDRKHAQFADISLRETLNKIAHFDTNFSTYRVDGRGAHYLILGGKDQRRRLWVAEILVSRLCKCAERAVRAL